MQRKTYIGSVEMRAADVWSHPHHELYRRWVKLFDAHCEPQGSLLVTLTVLAPGEIEYVHSVEQERAHALVVQRHEGARRVYQGACGVTCSLDVRRRRLRQHTNNRRQNSGNVGCQRV